MINKVKRTELLPTGRKAAFTLLTAACLLVQAGCKEEDKIVAGGNQQADPSAIIPSKEKKYHYRITEPDGSFSSMETRVKNVTDSIGIAVHHIETKTTGEEDETLLNYKAYSKNGITTNELSLPAAYTALIAELDQNPLVKEIKVTGFPHYQLFENKAALNSTVTFKGEKIRLYVKFEDVDEEGNTLSSELEATITYDNGKVVKVENLTTPAGNFNCSQWAYGYTVLTKVYNNGNLEETSSDKVEVQDWTAPGVGIVKSIETSGDRTQTVTELQKID
jgi:hypothetical protein